MLLLVKLDHFPRDRGEKKRKSLKPSASYKKPVKSIFFEEVLMVWNLIPIFFDGLMSLMICIFFENLNLYRLTSYLQNVVWRFQLDSRIFLL